MGQSSIGSPFPNNGKRSSLLIAVLSLCFLMVETASAECSQGHRLVGFVGDLAMEQHQLRGTVEILDDCTFKVSNLDMLSGPSVYWWGSKGEDMESMLAGFRIAKEPLLGNLTSAELQVTLGNNITWDAFSVLSVWSERLSGSYGHLRLEPSEGWEAFLAPPTPPPTTPPTPTLENGTSSVENGTSVANKTSLINSTSPLNNTNATSPTPTPMATLPPPEPKELRGAPVETMLQSCVELAPKLRVRWSVDAEGGSVDVALEGALEQGQYMSFGWAKPGATNRLMGGSDVVIAGYDDKGVPFAEDYYISGYTMCQLAGGKLSGVCADADLALAANASESAVANVQLLYAQRMDGVTFVKYRRRLQSPDKEYDNDISADVEQPVVWAIGPFHAAAKSPILHPLPHFHGPDYSTMYGDTFLELGRETDTCMGPLDARALQIPDTRVGLIATKKGADLLVGVGNSTASYPNPPSFGKSIYINGLESPVLQVERGVLINFTIATGAEYPFYLTDSPVGGGLGPPREKTIAGGPQAFGTPAMPYMLTWTPNHTTPNTLYYQAYTQKKMGWRIDVVDGGLSDMYPASALLADGKVYLHWAVHYDSISFAVRSTRPCGWLAIAFGDGMVKSNSYVGWLDGDAGRVATYWMDARSAAGVHPTKEMLTNTKVTVSRGYIQFEFTRLLRIPGSRNVIEPEVPLRVVWAYGEKWTAGALSYLNMHTAMSSDVTLVNLQTGLAKVEHLQPVFVVHGSMMFLAWGVLFPAGVLAARYLKYMENDKWFHLHKYAQTTGLIVAALGLLFAVGELKGLVLYSTHAKLGLTTMLLGTFQPVNAWFRPPKPPPGEPPRGARLYWLWVHKYGGRFTIGLSMVAMLTGILRLGKEDDLQAVGGLLAGLVIWFLALISFVGYMEYKSQKGGWWPGGRLIKKSDAGGGSNWGNGVSDVLDDEDEEEAAGLIAGRSANGGRASRGTEIQLEAMH